MAPRKAPRTDAVLTKTCKRIRKTWLDGPQEWKCALITMLSDPKKLWYTAGLFVALEIVVNVLIVENVPYTEIDWRAYMREVEGFLNGTLDYSKLSGETGPLVYPAGFVYVFSLLYYATNAGTNIKMAQYIFIAFYVILLVLVFRIYAKTRKLPPYVLIGMCCTSYRVHSIIVLRLFNDPIAMILLFASLNAFLDKRWYLGSLLYSLAVSIKMNILLFAPALLVGYLCNLGIIATALHLCVCGLTQVLLGLPFLLTNPFAYLKGAFNFGRVFEHQWTVNWRFLTEEQFVHPYFHLSLLCLHLLSLFHCVPFWIKYMKSYAKLKRVEADLQPQLKGKESVDMSTSSQLFILPLFTANFIGIMFSRSLHYQFYVWYYHTLPYLVWCTHYGTVLKFTILGVIELCWNTYPSTVLSSAVLHVCHVALFYGLLKCTSASVRQA